MKKNQYLSINDNVSTEPYKLGFFEMTIIIVIFLLVFGEACLVAFEFIVILSNTKLSNGCFNLYWALIFSGVVTIIISFVIMLFTILINRMIFDKERNVIYVKEVYFLQFFKIFANIWLVVIYFTIDQQCIDFWEQELVELLTFLDINFYLTWINTILMLLLVANILLHYRRRFYQQLP